MSDFGSSSNTSKGYNEISSPGAGGKSMDTSKTMTGETNTPVNQSDMKAKMIATGKNDPTGVMSSTNEQANVSRLASMDKSGFGGKVAKPL
jgi:hypothetical protein